MRGDCADARPTPATSTVTIAMLHVRIVRCHMRERSSPVALRSDRYQRPSEP